MRSADFISTDFEMFLPVILSEACVLFCTTSQLLES